MKRNVVLSTALALGLMVSASPALANEADDKGVTEITEEKSVEVVVGEVATDATEDAGAVEEELSVSEPTEEATGENATQTDKELENNDETVHSEDSGTTVEENSAASVTEQEEGAVVEHEKKADEKEKSVEAPAAKWTIASMHSFETIDEKTYLRLSVAIQGKEQAKVAGSFTVTIPGQGSKVVKSNAEGMAFVDYLLNEESSLLMGEQYHAHITFTGTIGELSYVNAPLNSQHLIRMPGLELFFGEKSTDTDAEFGGKIIQGEEASGDWTFTVEEVESGEVIARETLLGVKGLQQSYLFLDLANMLTTGKSYWFTVNFEGEVDGVFLAMDSSFSLELNEEEVELPAATEEEEQVEQTETLKETKKGIAKEENLSQLTDAKEKESVKEVAKGGKLPETAATEPHQMLFGALLVMLGALLLGFVYRRLSTHPLR
ncbi:hypothetical protein [Mechercharimyces sp. CAU 1602]|uniref:hypothetical protein n=1 Tax=Mechercharimyces sp. CAU 1602 TaxID=2973933 RepID=UPI0021628EBE|nr:hypothetical protein [Mechercharimyces sp. CAU 1602]MCS1352769.1 hypothetical protein [Mechercharimyces sp. CAU 1602]